MQKHSKLTVSTGALSDNSFVKRMQDIENAIARRAHELFASRGFTDGQDVSDWLTAESEVLEPFPLKLSETEEEITLKADLPGFSEKDIEVRVEPWYIFIGGRREEKTESKQKGEVVSAESRSSGVFRAINLPAEVDSEKVEAAFDKGVLQIVLPKKEAGKKVAIENKAA